MNKPLDKAVVDIKPSDINAKEHLWDSFGNVETEVSAGWIVRFCQEAGDSWAAFSGEALDAFYRKRLTKRRNPGDHFTFNGLLGARSTRLFDASEHRVGGAWIVKTPGGLYQVTEEFVRRCYQSSPRKAKKSAVAAAVMA